MLNPYEQQTATVARATGYIRTVRVKLLYARTNAQSRALKGLPTTDEPAPEPPTWRAIHEFSTEPSAEVRRSVKNDQNQVLKSAKQNEVDAYKFAKVHGKGEFF